MQKQFKIYSAYGYNDYARPLISSHPEMFVITHNIEDADIVLFAGGEDVNPALYNHPKHRTTHYNNRRDTEEMLNYNYAKETGKFILGICRGHQFVGVMNGCTLFQHVGNHLGYHVMHTDKYGDIQVNSSHHQMVNVTTIPISARLIGWAKNQADYLLDGDNVDHHSIDEPNIETEAVYYPESKAFTVQYHPEWLRKEHEAYQWWVARVIDLVKGKL